ncbi:exonuclease domain-containing protein [Bacteroidota bacterium]
MRLKLKRPLVIFDIETTGLSIATDRIVEISMLKIYPEGKEEDITLRVNPGIQISEEATAIHGISNEDVKNEPAFSEVADLIISFMNSCDLAGYNSNKFDIPLLSEELLRAGKEFDLKKCQFIDVQSIFFKKEPRTLVAAYKFYCDKDLIAAHSAKGDTKATFEILKSQLDRYTDLSDDISELSKFTSQTNNVDFAGRIVYDDEGVEVFNFGKYKGKPVEQVLKTDHGYYGWMMSSDFPQYTKKVLTAIRLRGMNTKV